MSEFPQRRVKNEVDGILLVDKPPEWTSFDVLNLMKHRFSVKKIGHCGTLDPMATGLLIVLLGKCTKLQDRLMCEEKVYEGALRLGVETDSEDSTGEVVAEHDASAVTEEQVRQAAQALTGEILQTPPMVSAIKREGKPLYKLARQGIVVEREPRPVTIFEFDLTEMALPEVKYRVRCSKGTYIRTLCADLGKSLGCGACMTALRRTSSGHIPLDGAVTIDQIKQWDLEQLKSALHQPEEFLKEDNSAGESSNRGIPIPAIFQTMDGPGSWSAQSACKENGGK